MTPTDLETLRKCFGRIKLARLRIKCCPEYKSTAEQMFIEAVVDLASDANVKALTALLADYERLKVENEQKTHALLNVMRYGTLRATLKGEKHE